MKIATFSLYLVKELDKIKENVFNKASLILTLRVGAYPARDIVRGHF